MSLIRPVALCLFAHEGRFLVEDFTYGGDRYLRPPGGGIDFSERAVDAMRREIMEELNAEITDPRLIAVLENPEKFIHLGPDEHRHEIVFLYTARFVREELYKQPLLDLNDNGKVGIARWLPRPEITSANARIEPLGLEAVLDAWVW